MFDASAEYYDLIYGSFKDYPREAAQIAGLLRQNMPHCRTVLDVACGSGEHARLLTEAGFAVDGVDLSAEFVEIARRKNPAGRFAAGDMSDFHLGRRYDALLCLFSSIGYLRTLDRVGAAFERFREHLAPGGVLLVEPWMPPGVLDTARVASHVGEANGVSVSRITRVEVDGRDSRLLFDYEITDATGTRHESEVHHLGLFTNDEMVEAFRSAGFSVEHDPVGLCDRGLYIAHLDRSRSG
jgi:SAM-dependent methyltransferase